ncbi:MAG: inositol monophosphatase family protein [Actinomycetota bacterium]
MTGSARDPARTVVAGTAYERELVFAHELADLAASITLPGFGGRLAVTLKADRTPVTELDPLAERALRDHAATAFPDDAFLGEEDGHSGEGTRVWVVDPIDGTKNYADAIPLWTTLVALVVDGNPVVGIIDVPALGDRYAAARGMGATHNGAPIEVSTTPKLAEAVVVHSGIEEWMRDDRLGDLARLAGAARRTRGLSDAWGHALVAQGSADILVDHDPCGEWDYAAGKIVVEEAGGRMTTLSGDRPHPGCDLLVSNGALHDLARTVIGGSAAGVGIGPG